MGFFKRLLSAGSKKNKKKPSAKEEAQDLRRYHSQTLPVLSEAESEAAADRLLRTASSRLGAMRYTTGDEPLPNLPNRMCTPPVCRVFLRQFPCKAHPEVDEKAETRSLPFLPNRRWFSCGDIEFRSRLSSPPSRIPGRAEHPCCVLTP